MSSCFAYCVALDIAKTNKIVIPVNKCHTFAVDIPEFQQHERKLQSIDIIKRPGFYRNFM